jgi:4-amino-4-deoxy-L-arabinose transferase-like glycosyltransferase
MVESRLVATGDSRPAVADRGQPVTWLAVAFVALATLLIAAHVYSLALDRPPGPDDSLYASEAARWLAGEPLTTMSGEPAVARPPLYVLALAGATALSGDWLSAERIVATASVVVAILAVATIAWSLAGAGAAMLALVVFIVPGVADAFARSGIDGLQAALVLSSVAVALALAGRNGSWTRASAVAVGFGLGLAILTKETALALAPWAILWAAGQPAGVLRPAMRWAGIASAVLILTVLPWWLFVYVAAGKLFPTSIEGIGAAAGIGIILVGCLLFLLLASDRVNGRVAAGIARIGERPRWWLAVAFCGAWALLIVVAFLRADARYALAGLPSRDVVVESIDRLMTLLLFPAATIAAVFVAIAIAQRRPMLRGLLLVVLLTVGLVAIVVVKGWDPRSALVPAVAASMLLPVGAAAALPRLSAMSSPRARRAGGAVLIALVVGVTSLNLIGLVRAADVPPNTQRWDGQSVKDAAAWLSTRLEPGETIVASWLFAASIDAMTEARYRIAESPTLQVRVGRPSEPILVANGTLFRENAEIPAPPPDDWLFVRRHPDGYLVGLSAQLLGDTIRASGTRFLVLTGEHPAQSTATIAESLVKWPGVTEVARFGKDDAEIVILEIDQDSFSVGPFGTQLNVGLLREWPDLVGIARRGADPGAALCQLLAGRSAEFVPDSARGQALFARLVPAGCPPAAS